MSPTDHFLLRKAAPHAASCRGFAQTRFYPALMLSCYPHRVYGIQLRGHMSNWKQAEEIGGLLAPCTISTAPVGVRHLPLSQCVPAAQLAKSYKYLHCCCLSTKVLGAPMGVMLIELCRPQWPLWSCMEVVHYTSIHNTHQKPDIMHHRYSPLTHSTVNHSLARTLPA
jgi:hypothetical protein